MIHDAEMDMDMEIFLPLLVFIVYILKIYTGKTNNNGSVATFSARI
jgi:hypothetical protein